MKRINLMPSEVKKVTAQKWLKSRLLKSRTSLIITVVLGLALIINLWQASSILRYKFSIIQGKKNINKLQAKLTQYQDEYAKIISQRQQIQKETKRVEARITSLQQIQAQRLSFAGVLANLGGLLPQDLWVKKITLNKDAVVIAGSTFDNAIVSQFMARLDESEYFRETSFNYTQKAELTDRKPLINFEVTTHVALEKLIK